MRTLSFIRPWRTVAPLIAAVALAGGLTLATVTRGDDAKTPEPVEVPSRPHPVPTLKGVVKLFTGTQEDLTGNWTRENSTEAPKWKVADGVMTANGGSITTKETFTNFQLHAEFKVPYMPDAKGQGRGNSGVGLQNLYEIQVLDSYGLAEPGKGDCGAVYDRWAPLVNACKPPRQWQTYDIVFHAAQFDDAGKKTRNANVTVLLNGIAVQNNREIEGTTGIAGNRPETGKPGPIMLQDHGNPIQFRNIWILPLPEHGSTVYEGK